jgi:hypothetical protein
VSSSDPALGSTPSEHPRTPNELAEEVRRAGDALLRLGDSRGEDLARTLAQMVAAVADEAERSTRLSRALYAAIAVPEGRDSGRPARSHRRAPGVLDPFAVFGDAGEDGLRARLGELSLDQLRDIVAEHGMDNDRLAMKWKDPARVIDRIVERVATRLAKGSAFRAPAAAAGVPSAVRDGDQRDRR